MSNSTGEAPSDERAVTKYRDLDVLDDQPGGPPPLIEPPDPEPEPLPPPSMVCIVGGAPVWCVLPAARPPVSANAKLTMMNITCIDPPAVRVADAARTEGCHERNVRRLAEA